jgi:cyclic beta-1,2-glucan synthetase
MNHAGIEGGLALTRNDSDLQLKPCLPKDWPEVTLTVTLGNFALHVTVANNGPKRGVARALLDVVEIACDAGRISLLITKGAHRLHLTVG